MEATLTYYPQRKTLTTLHYKFKKVSPKNGRLLEWSGVFETEEIALNWYEKYGAWHEQRGHVLKFIKYYTKAKDNAVLD